MNKRRMRPSQLLYVPPARRHLKKVKDEDLYITNSNYTTEMKRNEAENELKSKNSKISSSITLSNPKVKNHRQLFETCLGSSREAHSEDVHTSTSEQIKEIIKMTQAVDMNQDSKNTVSSSVSINDNEKVTLKEEIETTSKGSNLIMSSMRSRLTNKNECEIDKEKEEMKRAIVKINRKSRSLIKHYENDNALFIAREECFDTYNNVPKNESKIFNDNEEHSCTWEDILLDDIQETHKYAEYDDCHSADDDLCTTKNSDSFNFINKKLEDLDHVIEVYDFPESFKTQDIMHLYSDVHRDPMYIKWCDSTHALLVFSSPAQAKMALKYDKGIIKARSLMEASSQSKKIANKVDLKPAMRRPATNMQTARRLINRHLGTKVTISKENLEKEKQELKDAKERKRIQRQNEKDAWEGHPRTNIT